MIYIQQTGFVCRADLKTYVGWLSGKETREREREREREEGRWDGARRWC
jgi:hypothetical protein